MLSLSTRLAYVFCLSFLISTAFAQGKIAQFLDFDCRDTSSVNPTVSLPLDTCLVTIGAGGVVVQVLPACLTGSASATLQLYQDQACALPVSEANFYNDDNCLASNVGFGGVMFICGGVAEGNSDATSTSTVIATSALVPVAKATEATTTSAPGGLSSHTATGSNGLITSVTPASSTSNPSRTDETSPGGDSSSGLSQHDQIVLGIALPVGSLIVALLAWLCPKPWNRRGSEREQNDYQMLHYPVVHHMPHWHRG